MKQKRKYYAYRGTDSSGLLMYTSFLIWYTHFCNFCDFFKYFTYIRQRLLSKQQLLPIEIIKMRFQCLREYVYTSHKMNSRIFIIVCVPRAYLS